MLIGRSDGDVLATLPNPTIVAVIPLTVPVNVGLAKGALKFNAVCVAVLIGSADGDVLATLPSPTIVAVMPLTVPVNVGFAKGAFKFNAANIEVVVFKAVDAVIPAFAAVVASVESVSVKDVLEAQYK